MTKALLASAALLVASGCATTSGTPNPKDPWEGYNRPMYEFNDTVDKAVLKPISQGYQKVTPDFVQQGVSNFFENLQDLGTGLNNLLQGKLTEGAGDLGRLVVNSTIGILGLWDVATPMGLEKHHEDFGQTLGWWGVPPGPYFIIPLFGPSTLRDAPARYVDPSFAYNRGIDDVAARNSLFGLDVVRTRANLLKAEKVLDEAALDRYSFTRDAWLQRRRNMVFDGKPPKDPDDE
jgi:phospholipid-binding lipoprotein MlaA